MSKQEDLDTLDELVRKMMIDCLMSGNTKALQDLSPTIAYLAKNNVVSEKKRSSIEDNIAKRLEEAKARRGGVID